VLTGINLVQARAPRDGLFERKDAVE